MKSKKRPVTWSNAPQVGLNRFGEERRLRVVTLPRLTVLDTTGEYDAEECPDAEARIAVMRVVRRGRDCWEQIAKAESFESWLAIGAALAIGRQRALKVSGANTPWGRRYALEFSKWIREYGFAGMPKSTRSVAIELAENAAAIEAWRATLPVKQRRRLIHPLSNVRRWRSSTVHTNGTHPMDLLVASRAAWRRFVTSTGLLAPEQAAIVWQVVAAEIEHRQTPGYSRMWRT